ncbi:MAG TPA: hypothetical protein VHM24_00190 [Gemmatimonadaceae bacterium]|nr:hypothetical protein [Gemmatimonadaceae bacterium]
MTMIHPDDTVPIAALFFDDAGPHVLRSGTPSPLPSTPGAMSEAPHGKATPARGHELRALLNTSIAQLGAVSGETRRRTPVPAPAPVPIETLLYRGRAALARAVELRSEIVAGGSMPTRDLVDELLDLVVLASTE